MIFKEKCTCVVCGKRMGSQRSYKDVCSSKCKREYLSIIKPPLHSEINCLNCNTIFSPKNIKQKYCSKNCLNEHYKLTRRTINNEYSIFKRDNFQCIYCGKSSVEDGVKLQVDHILALSLAGVTDIDNLITACKPCNVSKSYSELPKQVIDRIMKILKERNSQLTSEQMQFIEKEIVELKRRDKDRMLKLRKVY